MSRTDSFTSLWNSLANYYLFKAIDSSANINCDLIDNQNESYKGKVIKLLGFILHHNIISNIYI